MTATQIVRSTRKTSGITNNLPDFLLTDIFATLHRIIIFLKNRFGSNNILLAKQIQYAHKSLLQHQKLGLVLETSMYSRPTSI